MTDTPPPKEPVRTLRIHLAIVVNNTVFECRRPMQFRGVYPAEIFVPWGPKGREPANMVFTRDAKLERPTDPAMWYSLDRVEACPPHTQTGAGGDRLASPSDPAPPQIVSRETIAEPK